jgi:hypothetical protein
MTYWPISSPSVFAATKRTDSGLAHTSHDGVEHKQSSEQHDGPNNASRNQSEAETLVQSNSGVEEQDSAHLSPAGVSVQSVEDDIHGTIIAIRVTRNGHMFATLTRTTLTVWQTKACSIASLALHVLTGHAAYCCFGLCVTFRAVR